MFLFVVLLLLMFVKCVLLLCDDFEIDCGCGGDDVLVMLMKGVFVCVDVVVKGVY